MLLVSDQCFLPNLFKRNLTGLLLFTYITLTMGSCGTIPDDKGEIIGYSNKVESKKHIPLGMVFIPAGTFSMGGGVNEGVVARTNITQNTTVAPFYMDEAPITNATYRKFIDTVRANPEAYGLNEAYINEKLMPDPTVWKKDFPNMFIDDSFGKSYWQDTPFDLYPVVGITWEAAQQFARVRSIVKNKYLEAHGQPPLPNFRLPTAAEWEYAAKGGRSSAQYPWKGETVRDQKGKLLANCQPSKGNYAECGYAYTSPVKAFPPNDYGLYDMAGNVAEWCQDVYSRLLIHKNDTIRLFYKDEEGVFRVIKGGSWKDYPYPLQTGVADCENKDIARSYIGFRCVMSTI